jgi:hypothetical protein
MATVVGSPLDSEYDRDNDENDEKGPIRLHTANALKWLGSLYRNPRTRSRSTSATRSMSISRPRPSAGGPVSCTVAFALNKGLITVRYPYGMSDDEFRQALQKVADSAKKP